VDERAVRYLRTLVLAALLGVPVALAAVAFQTAIHDVTHFVWDVVPDWLDEDEPPNWYVALVPAVGGLLVAAAIRLPGHGGHGPLEGISLGGLRPSHLPSVLLAALATLGFGLVLGPEAPLIALGFGLGAIIVQLVHVEETEARLLALSGAFAAIAVLFGSPLVAALLIFELVAASGAIPAESLGRALLPGFVAAGTGALVFTGVNDWPGVHVASLTLPSLPAYDTVRVADLAWCLALSVAAAALVVATQHVAHFVHLRAVRRQDLALPLAGLLVGLIAVAFHGAADRPAELVLFSGQEQLPEIVAETSGSVLALLVVGKGLAYVLSLAGGFRGGPVFPALVVGAALGALAADVLPGLESTPAVAAGIAAGTAAVLRVPFTAVLLATLLIGSAAPDVVPITVLAAAVGWLAAIALPNPEDRHELLPPDAEHAST
jgi:H+/Cl- antiporter ClcA